MKALRLWVCWAFWDSGSGCGLSDWGLGCGFKVRCFEACSVKGAGLGLRGVPIALVIPNLAAHLANPQLWW